MVQIPKGLEEQVRLLLLYFGVSLADYALMLCAIATGSDSIYAIKQTLLKAHLEFQILASIYELGIWAGIGTQRIGDRSDLA